MDWTNYWWAILLLVILVLILLFLLRWYQLLSINFNWEKKRHFPQWSNSGIITRDNYLLHANYNFVEDSKIIIIGIHSMVGAKEDFIFAKNFFAKKNMSLLSFDQRNWGKNRKWKYHSLGTTVTDIEDIISVLNERFPNQKIFLLGESLGSAIGALTIKRLNNQISGAILLNFATKKRIFKLTPNLIFKIFLGFCFNKQLLLPIDFNIVEISDNPKYIDYVNDRNYRRNKHQFTLLYVAQAKKITNDVIKNVNEASCPVMIVQSGEDIFADFDRIKENEGKWRTGVTYKYSEYGKHALLNDSDIEIILNDINKWILQNNVIINKN